MLFEEISALIEQSRKIIYKQASGTTVLLFWNIGKRINNDILENKRVGIKDEYLEADLEDAILRE